MRIGQAANCSYPNKVTVVTPEQLREAVKADHVCAEYKGNYRGIGNFIRSDVIVMDIDNDHSEEPAEWITAEKLEGIFPDMEYMLASSRHHLLPKEGKSARPRYHIYFPISEITDAEVYGNLKKALQKEYPFFDGNALDAARFIFGADCEEVSPCLIWIKTRRTNLKTHMKDLRMRLFLVRLLITEPHSER